MHLTNQEIEQFYWSHQIRQPITLKYDNPDIYTTNILGVGFYDYDRKSKDIKAWTSILESLDNVEYLWTFHKLNQETFNSICRMKNLKGLCIKWSSVVDLDQINQLQNLLHLKLGLSSSIERLDPIEEIQQLITFQIETNSNQLKINALKSLLHLEGLILSGGMYKKCKVDSLDFISEL